LEKEMNRIENFLQVFALLVANSGSLQAASSYCAAPRCCLRSVLPSGSDEIVGIAYVEEKDNSKVAISSSDYEFYCENGVECSRELFPLELACDSTADGANCFPCDEIAIEERGMFLVDINSGCIYAYFKANEHSVFCNGEGARGLPRQFVLRNALLEYSECQEAHIEAGYYEPCSNENSCGNCSDSRLSGAASLAGFMFLFSLLYIRR
jgi:hypothetical protein